ncbi:TPA: hypothetical protein ACY37O_002070 [Pasteurella multocida]|uniref:hypothetical protein n=1 Tax=Pasteurella multocida TaxID=747 RepID=UPI0029B7600C|nr:hypothetical protein [Pasteurella multocida]MDX3890769.1 hypothetical protein [Pasteurella multocida]HDR1252708.1 hypothetical protein [Pasteurella multocida]HDR1420186.1 hypothetical protein [Pasteurella multocida]HDR1425248.1 hypothetical protein [Pasteurella multocida]HDR1427658.1 hypothetical protein [Pasteurella multocida]
MELQISGAMIFNFVVSIAVFFGGVWFKRLDADFKDLKAEINKIKETYQSKELANHVNKGFSNQLDRIFDKLDSIEGKLDKKADK